MPTLDHVALAVADPDRSLAFYRDLIGIEGTVATRDFGYLIATPNAVTFTIFRGEPAADLGESHIGFAFASPDAVRDFRDRARRHGAPELEWSDEPGYVSIKVTDPDGYAVEVSWDQPS
jgi:catechol 2,3-dioxygenase-like lactoylglutathione lyase family enzyme